MGVFSVPPVVCGPLPCRWLHSCNGSEADIGSVALHSATRSSSEINMAVRIWSRVLTVNDGGVCSFVMVVHGKHKASLGCGLMV